MDTERPEGEDPVETEDAQGGPAPDPLDEQPDYDPEDEGLKGIKGG